MADDKPKLTRRRVLGGMAVIGGAGALGVGTTALFNDTEKTGDLSLAAGTVDLEIDYTFYYKGEVSDEGHIDGNEAITCDLDDLKPGDPMKFRLCPHVEGNPSYVQVSGGISVDGERGRNEPERNAPNPDGNGGELDTALNATLKYENGDVIKQGSFADVMAALQDGIKLDEIYGDGSEPCIILVVNFPLGSDNRSQSDSLTFELVFNAEQKRHNSNPFNGNTGNDNTGNGDDNGHDNQDNDGDGATDEDDEGDPNDGDGEDEDSDGATDEDDEHDEAE